MQIHTFFQSVSAISRVLTGQEFEIAIERTEGFSFAQLWETYMLGAQSAFEHGREVGVADVIEAIELQAAGAQELKASVSASGFVRQPNISASAEGSAAESIARDSLRL